MNDDRYELRTYRAAPGQLGPVLRACQGAAHGARRLVGAWTCEFGPLSRLLMLHRLADATADNDVDPAAHAGCERRLLRLRRPLNLGRPSGVVEFRTYTIAPGRREAYLERMLAALPIRERHSPNIGVFSPLSGPLDQVLHFWAYADIADRMRARHDAFADADWAAYLPTVYPYLAEMESQVLLPTDFSPLR